MALSMEEQRILAEIEQSLTRAEPVLAARLSRLEHPRPSLATVLRSPRGRMLASLAALMTLVLMSTLVYLFIAWRGIPQRGPHVRPSAVPRHPVISVMGPRHTADRSPVGRSALPAAPTAEFAPASPTQGSAQARG
jgi:hypothetical protein